LQSLWDKKHEVGGVEVMRKIRLFEVVCSSEEEEYVYYFDGEGSEEDFQRDVGECVVRVLDKYYRFVKVDENTYVRKRALGNKNVKKFIEWLRNIYGYKGRVWVDIEGDLVSFTTDDISTNLTIWKSDCECPVRFFADEFILRVEPSEVISSEEFCRCMEKKGWEKVEIESKGKVWFYEWGGFVQGDDGRWYNHVWNIGHKDVLTGKYIGETTEEHYDIIEDEVDDK